MEGRRDEDEVGCDKASLDRGVLGAGGQWRGSFQGWVHGPGRKRPRHSAPRQNPTFRPVTQSQASPMYRYRVLPDSQRLARTSTVLARGSRVFTDDAGA